MGQSCFFFSKKGNDFIGGVYIFLSHHIYFSTGLAKQVSHATLGWDASILTQTRLGMVTSSWVGLGSTCLYHWGPPFKSQRRGAHISVIGPHHEYLVSGGHHFLSWNILALKYTCRPYFMSQTRHLLGPFPTAPLNKRSQNGVTVLRLVADLHDTPGPVLAQQSKIVNSCKTIGF